MSYTIKKLEKSDTTLAKQLIKGWYMDDGVPQVIYPKDKYLYKILNRPNFHAYVALIEEQVVGGLTAYELEMFDTEENEMFLFEIGVSQGYRTQGIARSLIKALKQTCREKRIRIIFVGTSLDNEAAKQLYTTTGGEVEVIPWYTYHLDK